MNKIAFLFPGQGSQSVGMLAELSRHSDLVKNTFDDASQVVGKNLWKIAQEGPEEELNQTEITQPAMLAAGVSCWLVWKEMGGFDPDYMVGHSLGEFSALVASGALDIGRAVELVTIRSRLMQGAMPEGSGAMAAILGLDSYQLRKVCERAEQQQVVSCANFNSPIQIVISGHKEAVERACSLALEAGAKKAIPLAVSVPSHCELMRHAASKFALELMETPFSRSKIPVVHNFDVATHAAEDDIRMALEKQMWKPVRWTETIGELVSRGVNRFGECGPGKVLSGLTRRISRGSESMSLFTPGMMELTMENWGK